MFLTASRWLKMSKPTEMTAMSSPTKIPLIDLPILPNQLTLLTILQSYC